MFEKGSQYSLVPLSHRMDHTNSQRCDRLIDTSLPFSFEYEEFLVLITRILDGMRIVDVAFSLSHEEEIEGTIDGEWLVVPTMPSMFRREVSPGEKRALRWTTWITIIGIAVEIVRYGLKRLS